MAEGTSSFWGSKRWTDFGASDALNIDSDNDTIEYFWPYPVYVTGAVFLPTTAVTNAAGTVDVEIYRNTGAGDASETTLLGTWKLLATTTLALGKVSMAVFTGEDDAGDAVASTGGSLSADERRYAAPTGPYFIDVGDGLVFKVVEAADAGAGFLAVEYVPQSLSPIVQGNVSRVYEVPAV